MTSEIRANTIKNRVGLGTVSFTNTGPVISGVTTIASGGKLSIGGVVPTELLHVSDAGNPYILIEDTDADNQVGVKFKTTNYNWIAGLHGGVDTFKISKSTSFGSPATSDFFSINTVGKVSILNDLDVDGHTNLDNVSIAGVTTMTGNLTINSTSNARAIILPDNKRIYFGDGEDFWIGSNGTNGEVSGSLYFYNHLYLYDNVRLRIGHGQDLELFHNGTDSYIDNNTGNLHLDSASHIILETGSSTERVRITSGGYVGINVTNPQAFLDIGGNTDGDVKASFTRANDPNFRIQFRNESSSNNVGESQGKFGLFYASNSADICGMQFLRGSSTGAGSLTFTTGGTERLRIDSSGCLLVNTTSRSISSNELFEVKSTGGGFSHFRNNHSGYAPIYIDNEYTNTAMAPLITITDGGGNRAGLLLDPNSVFDITGQGAVTFSTGGTVGNATERVRIKNDGRIGINANPSVNHEYLHMKPVGNNVLDLRYELNSSTDIRHKFYDDAGVWRGGFGYTTYANSTEYPNFHDSFYFLTDPGSNGTLAVALRISREGQFIKPLTYQFIVETNGTSINGGAWSKLSGLTIDTGHSTGISNGTYWSNSNQRFTAPVSGTYNLFFGGWGTYSTSTGDRYAVCFRINGGSFKYISGGAYSIVDSPLNGYAINQNLSVNDYVELWYYSAGSNTWGGGHRVFWGGYFLG